MAQVIIVSNRLPVSVKRENGELVFSPSLGGLATGLASYAKDKRNTWIGWPGIASDDLSQSERETIINELAKYNCQPVFLSQRQIEEFYNGYSNTVLWPLFHTLPAQDKPGERRTRWWLSYRSVNKKFAEAAEAAAQPGASIWVHDYQLLLVPEQLRKRRPDVTIGFFLHIPFPAAKKFCSLLRHKPVMRGMLGADVIGFHTPGYVQNFLATCEAAGIGKTDRDRLLYKDRVIRVGDFPMGIDYEKYAGARRSRPVRAAVRKYRRRYGRKKVIVAVDRLDPTKGLVERLEAYRTLLETYPRLRGKVVFAMVAAPSRTDVPAYKRLAKRLAETVDEINRQFGTRRWQPIDYINVAVPFEEVTALFRIADVAFIAPLQDGMNLVAKEFIASTRKKGVLILSRTAGASEELPDALIVNPRRQQEVVQALYKGLKMHRRELRRRLRRMREHLAANTVHDWAKTFVGALQRPVPGTPELRTRHLNPKLTQKLIDDFQAAQHRLLLLDYDGSLVPFAEDYRSARPPKTVLDLLSRLGTDKANDVVLISGRSYKDLEKWFGHLPINLVAEHGAALKRAGRKTWHTIERPDTDWKQLLLPALEKYAARTPGARVEVKPHTLVWHYRAATPYNAQKYTTIIKRILRPFLKHHGLEMMQGNKILEIKNPQISKGKAAISWLKHDYDFVLGLGDDLTDEELFSVMPADTYSIKVGRGRTAARFRLAAYRDVRHLLKQLTS